MSETFCSRLQNILKLIKDNKTCILSVMDFPITVPFLIYFRKTSKVLMGKQYFTKAANVWLASLSKITLPLWAFLSFYKKANCVGSKINSWNNLYFPSLQIYSVLLLKEVFRFTNSPRLLWPPPHLFYCCYEGRVNFLAPYNWMREKSWYFWALFHCKTNKVL